MRSRYRTGAEVIAPGARLPALPPPPKPGQLGGVDILPATRHLLRIPDAVLAAAGAPNWYQLNPSCVVVRGQLFVSVRLFHPRLWSAGGGRANVLCRIGEDWRVADCQAMRGVDYEDMRLFCRGADQHLEAIGGFALPGKHAQLALLTLSNDGALERADPIYSPRAEKNWMPLVTPEGFLRLVYRCDPLTVLDWDGKTLLPSVAEASERAGRSTPFGDGLRGSSQLVPYEGGYLAVVHERATAAIHYHHRFVRFDESLTRMSVGKPFVFEHEGIEFCCGLARWMGKWVLSYGLDDHNAKLAVCDDDTVWGWTPDAPWMLDEQAERSPDTLPAAPVAVSGDAALDALMLKVTTPPVQSLPGWCTPEKARRLVELVLAERPINCVELGVFGGRSFIPIALALKHNGCGFIDGIDPYTVDAANEGLNDRANVEYWSRMPMQEIGKGAQKAIEEFGVEGVATLTWKRSHDVVADYADGSLDLLHQDSNHSEEVSVAEVRAWLPKLRAGGWWVFDDSDWATTQAAQFLLRENGCVKVEDRRYWAIYRKGTT